MHNTPSTPTAFKRLLRFAHPGLLFAAAILLGVQGFLTSKYYHDALGTGVFNTDIRTNVAAAASIGFKLLAFGLLFISVLDFSEGRKRVGKWGFLATGVLNLYFVYESHSMASMWAETPEAYWHIFPMLLAETLMVLFVEWRLAFSVGHAQESESHLAAAALREQSLSEKLATALSELSALQSEKAAAEDAQRIEVERKAAEEQRLAQLEAEKAERERQQREADAAKTISDLQRSLQRLSSEKGKPAKSEPTRTREKLLRQGVALTKQAGYFPGNLAVERSLGLSDGNARKIFGANGGFQSEVEQLLKQSSEMAEAFSEN